MKTVSISENMNYIPVKWQVFNFKWGLWRGALCHCRASCV